MVTVRAAGAASAGGRNHGELIGREVEAGRVSVRRSCLQNELYSVGDGVGRSDVLESTDVEVGRSERERGGTNPPYPPRPPPQRN